MAARSACSAAAPRQRSRSRDAEQRVALARGTSLARNFHGNHEIHGFRAQSSKHPVPYRACACAAPTRSPPGGGRAGPRTGGTLAGLTRASRRSAAPRSPGPARNGPARPLQPRPRVSRARETRPGARRAGARRFTDAPGRSASLHGRAGAERVASRTRRAGARRFTDAPGRERAAHRNMGRIASARKDAAAGAATESKSRLAGDLRAACPISTG
jgi:hypothetical protein